MKRSFIRQRPIQPAAHAACIQRLFPDFHVSVRCGRLRCVARIAPEPWCQTYTCEITYRLNSRPDGPRVFVSSPELMLREGEDEIPHTYARNELCLFLPHAREWHPYLQIAHTIVPWTSLWLYYYEVWLATGEWMGGGVHIGRPDRLRKRER